MSIGVLLLSVPLSTYFMGTRGFKFSKLDRIQPEIDIYSICKKISFYFSQNVSFFEHMHSNLKEVLKCCKKIFF
jgi:hypothetical protein